MLPKILLFGYGKMGRIIHESAKEANVDIVAIYDKNIDDYKVLKLDNVDVAIEFTHPEQAFQNIKTLLQKKIPVVTGTTGWFHRIDELKNMFNPDEHTLIYGANFSVGMNILYQIINLSSYLINQTGLYDIYGFESHHRKKADTPSGTAKVIADILLKNFDNKDNVIYDINNKTLSDNEFTFSSIRAGNIIGYHEVGFDSDFDEIKLIHNAKTRKGFAIGALLAAKFAMKNKGFFNFNDVFTDIIKEGCVN